MSTIAIVWRVMHAPLYFLVAASIWAFVVGIRRSRTERGQGPTRKRGRAWWVAGLVIAGPIMAAASYAVGEYAVLPIVRQIVWPAARWLAPWPAYLEREDPVYSIEQLIAVGSVTTLMVTAIAFVFGRWQQPTRLAGYWLANPMTLLLGYVLVHRIVAPWDVGHRPDYPWWLEYMYWPVATWGGLVLLASPLYAWAFYAAARLRRR